MSQWASDDHQHTTGAVHAGPSKQGKTDVVPSNQAENIKGQEGLTECLTHLGLILKKQAIDGSITFT